MTAQIEYEEFSEQNLVSLREEIGPADTELKSVKLVTR